MKICRFCWEIRSQDDEYCDGVKVERHEKCTSFFDSPNDMIQSLTNKNAVRAIKLQGLLEDKINNCKFYIDFYDLTTDENDQIHRKIKSLLQSLVEESQNTNKELGESTCPKCGYDGLGVFDDRTGFQQHAHQLNPNNPFLWICGNCSEAFQRKTKEDEDKADG